MTAFIGRREFITLLGAAVVWPVMARAQQPSMPVIGYQKSSQSANTQTDLLRGFRQGLSEIGYIEGENVAVNYRWADNEADRLPALAAELVRRQVAVIAASGSASEFAAKATTTIPIRVSTVAEDPVRLGLSGRLGGNLTRGVNFFSAELAAKRLEVLASLYLTLRALLLQLLRHFRHCLQILYLCLRLVCSGRYQRQHQRNRSARDTGRAVPALLNLSSGPW